MDWRKHIREELRDPHIMTELEFQLDRLAGGDPALVRAIRNGGFISFPHTALSYSGEMTARLVASLYAAGVEQVLAIGVLHQGALPPQYAAGFAELFDPGLNLAVRRERAAMFSGGFIRHERVTAYGEIPILSKPSTWTTIRHNDSLLAGEFSLDYFLALIRLAADLYRVNPLPVFPVYIGILFDPVTGSYELAHAVAEELASLCDRPTAFVVTGDVVHYGTTYSDPQEMAVMPTDVMELERWFMPLVRRAYELAFYVHDYPEAFRYFNDILHNDQRFLFPVVAELLGIRAVHEVLQFSLSDYSRIWNVSPPSVVASSLLTIHPA